VVSVAFSPDGDALATGSRDTTALIWDLQEIRSRDALPAAAPDASELDGLWNDLRSDDPVRGRRAVWALVAAPEKSLPLLKARLRPATDDDVQPIRRLILQLDHEEFVVREAASKELADLGAEVETALRHALEGQLSPEARRRIETLLALPEPPTPAGAVQRIRALQVLEQLRTPEARQLLESVAAGSPWAKQTRDAQGALERLKRRGP
jgi:hypothetical protein